MSTATERKRAARQAAPEFSSAQKQSLRRRILSWYRTSARDLPWRQTRDPYCIWISEIMLQQTQVATVRGYYQRFITELPTVGHLASIEEQQVLRLWEGMGYYRRARQLHAAAKEIVARYGGQFPSDVSELMKLPGIGRYTAGAIASIAFDRRASILEANTVRLLSRLIAYRDDPLSPAGQQRLWQLAEKLLPAKNVAAFNQSLMELGSLVCKPTEPLCHECPLSMLCATNAAGLQREIPLRKAQAKVTELHEAAVVIRRNGRVLMRQCGRKERWAGLWDFPRFTVEAEGPLIASEEITQKVLSQTGIRCRPGALMNTIRHGVTRFRITLECYEAAFVSGRARSQNGSIVAWIRLSGLDGLPLSTTGRKIAKLLTTKRNDELPNDESRT